MARVLSTDLQTILAGDTREIVWTADISFPTIDSLRLSSEPIDLYSNDLNDTSEIRLTMESPADRVGLQFQNVDGVLGRHLVDNLAEWLNAECVVGRLYRGSGLEEWIELFPGVVQQPDATDLVFSFDVLSDLVAPGQIVCNRTLALPCSFVFKDPKTCGYVGAETACNHHLRSKSGCDGLGWGHAFGGFEHRYNPDASAPGTGGNIDIGNGGGNGCPRLDQWIAVIADGQFGVKKVADLTTSDLLLNPIDGSAHPIRSLHRLDQIAIYEVETKSGARCYSSPTHKLITCASDRVGQPVTQFWFGDPVMVYEAGCPAQSSVKYVRQSASIGSVVKIEMISGHIYAAGDTQDGLIVAHNTKNPVDVEINQI
ncbi:MAG: hypothetical protein IPN69_08315 [Acidobacteria bacterium]|nr:hypothetical protein [Acidobacteriota bacterium]